ncbi:hypothetical protein AVEN_248105-1 [Araneus ventricosus]|uniref:Uncharacterized protein n=1 Tax=Araneus ventricosus TaxID=182803 RepID=A0A4Y2SJA8_ARAVE|nr:hypothetical protein AVEN_248105-1 [Araneus ventricosus]
MQNKVIPSILCFFSLLVVIQGQITPPDNLQQYYKCWTFAECVSDGPAHDKFENCVSTVSYKSLFWLPNLVYFFIRAVVGHGLLTSTNQPTTGTPNGVILINYLKSTNIL